MRIGSLLFLRTKHPFKVMRSLVKSWQSCPPPSGSVPTHPFLRPQHKSTTQPTSTHLFACPFHGCPLPRLRFCHHRHNLPPIPFSFRLPPFLPQNKFQCCFLLLFAPFHPCEFCRFSLCGGGHRRRL